MFRPYIRPHRGIALPGVCVSLSFVRCIFVIFNRYRIHTSIPLVTVNACFWFVQMNQTDFDSIRLLVRSVHAFVIHPYVYVHTLWVTACTSPSLCLSTRCCRFESTIGFCLPEQTERYACFLVYQWGFFFASRSYEAYSILMINIHLET